MRGPRKYLHRSFLGSGDVLRAVVCNCVSPAECEGRLKLFTHPRRVDTVIGGAPHRAAAERAPRRHHARCATPSSRWVAPRAPYHLSGSARACRYGARDAAAVTVPRAANASGRRCPPPRPQRSTTAVARARACGARARERPALPQHARRLRRGQGMRNPCLPPHPNRPTL